MPRPSRKTEAPATDPAKPVPNAIVSSAAQVTSKRRRGIPKGAAGGDWQTEAWQMLDTVGELEFYRRWIANALSKVTLHVTERIGDEEKRVTTGLPAEAMAELFGGEAGQSQMLAALAGHLAIPGESWLVGLLEPPTDPDGPDMWRVMSKDEVSQEGSAWVIDRGDGEKERYEDGSKDGTQAEALVIRLWSPHPKLWVQANSSVRSALPILRELVGLSKHVGSSIDSRLAGAGLLLMPSEITFSSPLAAAGLQQSDVDDFMATLTAAMEAALSDPASPAARVPIIVKAPGALLGNIQHITFDTPFSERTLELRTEARTRLAGSLDIPAEVLLGMADVNHWTGWLLDENAIKLHVEPLVELIAHSLTTRFLWPVLMGGAETLNPDLRRFTITGDTSALRQRPNVGAEAQVLHDRLIITDEALARESGNLSGDDLLKPGSDEFKRRLLQKIAGGVTTADVTVAALAELGVILVPAPSEVDTAAAVASGPAAVPSSPEAPAIEGPPSTPPVEDQPGAQTAALLLGSEAWVLRAVEKARNRHRGGARPRSRTLPPEQLDAALVGAWEQVPRVAAVCGVDEERLRTTLDTYTRTLLTTGAEHDAMALHDLLRDRVLARRPAALGG